MAPEPDRPTVGQLREWVVRGMQRWVGSAMLLLAVVLLTGALLAGGQVPLLDPPAPGPPAVAPAGAPGRPSPAPGSTDSAPPRSTVSATEAGPPTPVPLTPVQQPDDVERDMRPARVRIPALGIDHRPVPLGVLDDGSLEAPRRYPDVGWWKDWPLPGAEGNAVLVGHVDSETGPAAFYGLTSLQHGDLVAVTRRDAAVVRFRVRGVERFPLENFPAGRVYRRGGPSGLVLITCGGEYDRAAGRYLDNVVVFADRTGSSLGRAAASGTAADPGRARLVGRGVRPGARVNP